MRLSAIAETSSTKLYLFILQHIVLSCIQHERDNDFFLVLLIVYFAELHKYKSLSNIYLLENKLNQTLCMNKLTRNIYCASKSFSLKLLSNYHDDKVPYH